MTKEQLLDRLADLEAEKLAIRKQLLQYNKIKVGKYYKSDDSIHRVTGIDEDGYFLVDSAFLDDQGLWFDCPCSEGMTIDWEESTKEEWDEVVQAIKDRV